MDHPEHATQAFPKEALERIAHKIADVEEATGSEIRVSIRDFRDASEAGLSMKELAQQEFGTLRLHHNDARYGILLLVLYHERKFYVYGDEGVHRHVHPETWNDVAKTLTKYFSEGAYEAGVMEAVERIAHHLKNKLPKPSEKHEMSAEVTVR